MLFESIDNGCSPLDLTLQGWRVHLRLSKDQGVLCTEWEFVVAHWGWECLAKPQVLAYVGLGGWNIGWLKHWARQWNVRDCVKRYFHIYVSASPETVYTGWWVVSCIPYLRQYSGANKGVGIGWNWLLLEEQNNHRRVRHSNISLSVKIAALWWANRNPVSAYWFRVITTTRFVPVFVVTNVYCITTESHRLRVSGS